ncbi:glycerol acyltransferase [Roseomonas stagni]|uniref:Glycerol acyltransferase n=1 Tax=Falsiroseomonas algicola TaxID=2716930 RepID=A0A6M1LM51_9PROT|nr:lysophospholipid acyltransferase family protein [Falsiroseomonas algicola]NGM21079.1 glycerol acyltransferase [Falsiroseomonas algicola]
MAAAPKPEGEDPVPLFDPRRMAFFHFMFRRFFAKHMRAARVARWGMPREYGARPLVIFANHPGWWDGVAFMLLSQRLFRGRTMFIPMDAQALSRYAFMKRLGVFGIETGTPRGAVAFLRTAKTVLAAPDRMLWMNAPGRFSDVRERPVPIAPGMTRLPEMAPDALFVPLALDYPFWTERKAEMLCAFGDPIEASALLALPRDDRAPALSQALAQTMDRLALDAIARDPARFETLLRGPEGMGGVWQLWRRLRSTLRGERFDPRHDPRQEAG